jgi:hypothetical protein
MPSKPNADANQALNEILVILHRSLPLYLSYAAPWVTYGNEDALRILDHIVAEKKEHVRRITQLLEERRRTVALGEFSMDYTSLHDVSLGFLIKHLSREQRRDVRAIESRLHRLNGDPEGRALAQDVLQSAQAHLQSFESLDRQTANAA